LCQPCQRVCFCAVAAGRTPALQRGSACPLRSAVGAMARPTVKRECVDSPVAKRREPLTTSRPSPGAKRGPGKKGPPSRRKAAAPQPKARGAAQTGKQKKATHAGGRGKKKRPSGRYKAGARKGQPDLRLTLKQSKKALREIARLEKVLADKDKLPKDPEANETAKAATSKQGGTGKASRETKQATGAQSP